MCFCDFFFFFWRGVLILAWPVFCVSWKGHWARLFPYMVFAWDRLFSRVCGILFIFKFFFFFFLKWIIFKILIEFVTVLLLFYVSGFWQQGMWDLSFLTRDWTWTPALEGEVLTTGLPGKSLEFFIFKKGIWRSMVCGHSCSSLGIWLHLQPLWWGRAKWHFWVELCVIHM